MSKDYELDPELSRAVLIDLERTVLVGLVNDFRGRRGVETLAQCEDELEVLGDQSWVDLFPADVRPPHRVIRTLVSAGVRTKEQVAGISPASFSSTWGVGDKTLEIISAMRR